MSSTYLCALALGLTDVALGQVPRGHSSGAHIHSPVQPSAGPNVCHACPEPCHAVVPHGLLDEEPEATL